jgi:hypothetical protein
MGTSIYHIVDDYDISPRQLYHKLLVGEEPIEFLASHIDYSSDRDLFDRDDQH